MAGERILGHRATVRVGRALTARRLRVLAYHDVPDERAFAAHVQELRDNWSTIDAGRVVSWLEGRSDLPRRAVWVTFDDGDVSVVKVAQPLLAEAGVPATLFVCPGLIEAPRPAWWRVVEHAASAGLVSYEDRRWTGMDLVRYLKTISDRDRRAFIHRLEGEHGLPDHAPLGEAHLRCWEGSGMDTGNHTWDHPCLDRCAPAEQRRQILLAQRWLDERRFSRLRLFAYPNGNATSVAAQTLRSEGYRLATTFDHRLASEKAGPMHLSRLRIDADAPVMRLRAILSGLHSGLLPLREMLA